MEQQEKEYTPNRDYVVAIARPGKGFPHQETCSHSRLRSYDLRYWQPG